MLRNKLRYLFRCRKTKKGTTPTDSTWISEPITDIELPQDLITEILVRLPVKSLLKFKCVSKLWFSLISSQQFIRSHFAISSMEGGYLYLQLLFSTMANMKQCSLYSAFHDSKLCRKPFWKPSWKTRRVSDIEFPSQDYISSIIVGTVNGLVCLQINTFDLFLWNPVLKKVKHLPDSNVRPEAPFNCVSYTYSFGYDELNDDYKVVCSISKYGAESVFEDEVKVYSLRADSWRRNDELKSYTHCDYGLYANGKIYWPGVVSGASTENWTKIVSLDMVSEKHGELQFTDTVKGDYKWNLGVLGERLCVLCDYQGMKADLWAMDKYAVEESWSKLVSIPYADVNPQMPYFSHRRVICILGNGEIVLANNLGLLAYNSKKKESRKIRLDVGKSSIFKVAAYVESLVWPYA